MILIKSVTPWKNTACYWSSALASRRRSISILCCAARCSSRFAAAARCFELCGLMRNSARLCGPMVQISTPMFYTARIAYVDGNGTSPSGVRHQGRRERQNRPEMSAWGISGLSHFPDSFICYMRSVISYPLSATYTTHSGASFSARPSHAG
jgi:hypothetical protein